MSLLKTSIELMELHALEAEFKTYVKSLPMRTTKRIWLQRIDEFREDSNLCPKSVVIDSSTDIGNVLIKNEILKTRQSAEVMFREACRTALKKYDVRDRIVRNVVVGEVSGAVSLICSNLQSYYNMHREDN